MSGPSLAARLGSRAVRAYLRLVPFERGKYRLRSAAARAFLVSRLEDGSWIRVTGASGYEWDALAGIPRETRTLQLLSRLLRPGMTVLDVGANIGAFTLAAARLVGSGGRVHAFEPTPVLVSRLRDNLILNGLENVVVNQIAVSETAGTLRLHLSESSEANSLVLAEEGGGTIEVRATTLDEYAEAHALRRVAVMKVDVEGAELMVVRGARRLLEDDDPPLIIMEFNPATLRAAGTSPAQLRQELGRLGFTCHALEQLTTGSDPVVNVLATRPAHWDRHPGLADFGLVRMGSDRP